MLFDGSNQARAWSEERFDLRQPHRLPKNPQDEAELSAERKRSSDDNIVLVSPMTGAVQDVLYDHAKNWVSSWSPDGRNLYYAKHDEHGVWNIWALSLSTRNQKQMTSYSALNSYVRYPAMSPRGNQIVYEYTVTTGNIWMLEFK